ncbi:MAG TPA: hypothetical protein VKA95_10785 [Nitrososphaeraceae archaeon]|nr:hypothetical protein [Nitrososphaeraceae archaeon]
MGSSNDWIMPVIMVGGLAIGGIMLLPSIMKSVKGGNNGYDEDEDYIPLSRAEEATKAVAMRAFEEGRKLPLVDLDDLVPKFRVGRDDDDAYLITDEDFRKLDIGKKDRRWLNRQRKLKDARLERVLYGDDPSRPLILPFAGAVNTVTPYGLAPSPEFTRLAGAEGLSRSNTRGNTVNLY